MMTHTAFGARHALGLVASALAITVPISLLAFSGPTWSNAVAQSGGNTVQSGPLDVAATDFPALSVVRTIVGDQATWGKGIPTTPSCESPSPVVSATRTDSGVTTGVYVMPVGAGGEAMAEIAKCSKQRPEVDGRTLAVYQVGDATVEVWNRGDVLVSLIATRAVDTASLDAELLAALNTAGCADLNPSVKDARRNPARSDYTPYTTVRTVTIPPSTVTTKVAEDAVPHLADSQTREMPDGLEGPPEPAPVAKPDPLTHPGADPNSVDVAVQTEDKVGPGCGWAFTEATAPIVDAAKLEADAKAAEATARKNLPATQAQWEKSAEAFNAQWDTWSASANAWNAYVTALDATHASWEAQSELLSRYDRAKAGYDAQTAALAAFRADQKKAGEEYAAAVKACAAPAPDPSPSPGATPDVSPTPEGSGAPAPSATPTTVQEECPAARPAILDEQPPAVGPQPAVPALWKAGDPLPY